LQRNALWKPPTEEPRRSTIFAVPEDKVWARARGWFSPNVRRGERKP